MISNRFAVCLSSKLDVQTKNLKKFEKRLDK
nr:MAG TPA: hypothetical protein [Caudoviricetes sp.]